MRYALLVRYDETAEISPGERSRRAAGLSPASARQRFDGEFAGGLLLQPASTAATVRCWDGGDVMVSPGSVTAAGEQLAACFVIDCPGADEAIDVATRIPAAWYGSVEVRPVAESGAGDMNGLSCRDQWPIASSAIFTNTSTVATAR